MVVELSRRLLRVELDPVSDQHVLVQRSAEHEGLGAVTDVREPQRALVGLRAAGVGRDDQTVRWYGRGRLAGSVRAREPVPGVAGGDLRLERRHDLWLDIAS
jgi:hypothetical protein